MAWSLFLTPWTAWFFPSRCELCGALGERAECAGHGLREWADEEPEPRCLRCARRLPPGIAADRRCGGCHDQRLGLARLRVLGSYQTGGALRAWILAFKHGRRADLAAPLAAALCRKLELSERPGPKPQRPAAVLEAWIPVPVHWTRRWTRGYDQAECLAQELAGLTGIPCVRALYRRRATRPQGSFWAGGRQQNVRSAFAVHPECRARLRGRRVVLVDDVCTSGATLRACAQVLRQAGALRVEAVCLARVEADQTAD